MTSQPFGKIDGNFTSILRTLEESVQSQKFTAWAVANTKMAVCAYFADEALPYNFGLKEAAEPYLPLFDLASMSKAIFTNTLFRARLPLSDFFKPLEGMLKESNEAGELMLRYFKQRPGQYRIVDFLDHVAGSKNWIWFGRGMWIFQGEGAARVGRAHVGGSTEGILRKHVRRELTEACLNSIHPTQRNCVYSDVDYFLLSRILENLSDSQAISDWKGALEELNTLLGTRFLHASLQTSAMRYAVPSHPYIVFESHDSSNEKISTYFGAVHDTNGNILASLGDTENLVSGHVGLYGTVLDALRAAQFLANSQREALEQARKIEPQYGNNVRFVLGLDTPSTAESMSGLKQWPLSPNVHVAGHLGYTGTSFWFANDSEKKKQECHVLLTNRTSRRECVKAHRVPRLCTVVSLESGECSYYLVENGQLKTELAADEFLAHNQFHFGASQRFWNDKVIAAPSDVAGTRREVGRALWSL